MGRDYPTPYDRRPTKEEDERELRRLMEEAEILIATLQELTATPIQVIIVNPDGTRTPATIIATVGTPVDNT